MDIKYYLTHYFSFPDIILFFLLALLIIFVMYMILHRFVLADKRYPVKQKTERFFSLTERFYEVIFSGASILFFIAVYYLIERFLPAGGVRDFWEKYVDFLLLAMLIGSCLFNSLLDHYVIPFKRISKDEMAAGRMIGMLYMFIIFAYIKFIYEDNNYDSFIIYFLGLMIGRFVYFDASFSDFVNSIKMASRNFFLMLMALGYTAIMALVGFKTDYLLTHNGVVTNLFIAHLFMIAAITLVDKVFSKFFETEVIERAYEKKAAKKTTKSGGKATGKMARKTENDADDDADDDLEIL
ncbi:MAG: hypothetical protein K6E13_06405 [Lachnospiraceae bacterium]|nr:hypothetical protein [Lachnospiraceae bacterium]